MRILFFIVAVMAMLIFSAPVWASLPHYNQDIGYTIWLPENWSEVEAGDIDTATRSHCPLPVHGMTPDWKAGYFSPSGPQGPTLLVEVKHGRKMHAAAISNFNRFIVQSLSRTSRDAGAPCLKDARYIRDKKTLRLVSEVEVDGKSMVSLAYIVYTRKGMLTFVGYVEPEDTLARATIDKAVLSLYLDEHIRYEPSLTGRERAGYGDPTQ